MIFSSGFLTDFPRILDNRVKKIVAKVGEPLDSEYLKYMTKRTGAERVTTDIGITGLGMANFIADAGIAPSDAPIQGFEKNYTQQHLTHKVRLSFQTMHFLIKSKSAAKLDATLEKRVIDINRALESAKEYYAQNFLAQGFNATWNFAPISGVSALITNVDATTADGIEWWSQAHLREDAGPNWSNVIVDGVTPSPVFQMSAYEATHQGHSLKKDGRGLPFGGIVDTMLAVEGSATYQQAKRIKATLDRGFYPGTLNDAPSVPSFNLIGLKNYGGTGVGQLQWFFFDSSKQNEDYGPQYIESLGNTMAPTMIDIENKDTVMQGDCIFQMGASDMRAWMASNGDGVTV